MPNESEADKILKIKLDCKICKGDGYIAVAEGSQSIRLEDCQCVREMAWKYKLLESNIPKRYQEWDFSKFYPKFIEANKEVYEYLDSYVQNLDTNIEEGAGFWLCSTPGLCKSSIISYILRSALEKDYAAYFSKAAMLQNLKFSALKEEEAQEKIDYIINDVQILGLEELEKVYLTHDTAMPNHLFYQLISDLYDAKKAILISTNAPRDAVLSSFPSYISDRLMTIDYMTLHGKSGRR